MLKTVKKVRKVVIPAAGSRKILAIPEVYVRASWWRIFGTYPAFKVNDTVRRFVNEFS